MCFIGHGSFGIIGKQIWCNYFGVFGISQNVSYQLMPLIGVIDILFGITILFYPLRAVVAWLVVWGTFTALLRPLSGEPFGEFIERAGNFGAPLALLFFSGIIKTNFKELFRTVKSNDQYNSATLSQTVMCLRIVVFFLLAGHGWLNLIEKKSLLTQYASLGFINPATVAQYVGVLEITAAFSILIRPLRLVVLAFFIWKVTSELFYPHHEIFEWIERGGSYGSLLALWFALSRSSSYQSSFHEKISYYKRMKHQYHLYNYNGYAK